MVTQGVVMPIRNLAAALLMAVAMPAAAADSGGKALFDQHCASCHEKPAEKNIPPLAALQAAQPLAIVNSLRDGLMRLQGRAMSDTQHIVLAEYLTGKTYVKPEPLFTTGLCKDSPVRVGAKVRDSDWNGWGGDLFNRRYAQHGGIASADLPKLKLKWAFGVPGVTQHRSQPAVLGNRLFMGSQSGALYGIDARTGCTHWVFQALSGIRTAVSVGPVKLATGGNGHAVYFSDGLANAYAVDAQSGGLLWRMKIDEHQAAKATGAPALYKDRLYVGISGVNESMSASSPGYECCTFRGSLTSLDANTGKVIWKVYTGPEPERRGTSSAGKPLWGPAGASIWSAPTIDEPRGLIYVATGNGYADPPEGKTPVMSVSVIAIHIRTGKIEWSSQVSPGGDTWLLGCGADANTGPVSGPPGAASRARGAATPAVPAAPNANCPKNVGPDFDISASPVLVKVANGKQVILVTQKASVATALDPTQRGRILWQRQLGKGSPVGGVYGLATDGVRAFFPVADQLTVAPGGLFALDPGTGNEIWKSPPQPTLCTGNGCSAAQSAAATAIPGAVFSGSADGGMRAYDARTGKVIWLFDTNRSFQTVNGVTATGGSIDGPGPVVAGGMLYVTAGNGGVVGRAGNVLLAFEVGEGQRRD